jgi:hypothetical protein
MSAEAKLQQIKERLTAIEAEIQQVREILRGSKP